ncbi:MAG TPA: EF-hand domain-containing protein [Rhodocyclaceae bacterium]|nr:EF-hand domain-containing protein [Rhodocyclaceae bacterium]
MMVSALYLSVPPLEAARPVALKGIAFSQLDLDRNGYIERKEMSRPEFTALLQSADLDRDGRLSEAEFDAAQSAEQALTVKSTK